MVGRSGWWPFVSLATACTWVPLGDATETRTVEGPTKTVQVEVPVPTTITEVVYTDDIRCIPDNGKRTCWISGTLRADEYWDAATTWILTGPVFVGVDTDDPIGDGGIPVTLTIQSGTTIYGEPDGQLIVSRGSKIEAVGTQDEPIVFTSNRPVGSRANGDWRGLVINGRAPFNTCFGVSVAGEVFQGVGPGTGFFGGSEAADDSGTLQWVVIEFAGRRVYDTQLIERNGAGITFHGVGNGTVVEHLHVHRSDGDGVVWVGGTVDLRYAIVTAPLEDGFDYTDGWTGRAQFLVLQQQIDPATDADGLGIQGLDGDSNFDNNEATPRSNPTLSNVTLLGAGTDSSSEFGLIFRNGTAARLYNFVIAGFGVACIDARGASVETQMNLNALLAENTVIDCVAPVGGGSVITAPELSDWFQIQGTGNTVLSSTARDGELVLPFDPVSPDFHPKMVSAASTGGATVPDVWFTPTTYRGAIDPNGEDWTDWIKPLAAN